MKHRTPTKKCTACGIGLSKEYKDTLCPSCRGEQDERETEARLAAGGA